MDEKLNHGLDEDYAPKSLSEKIKGEISPIHLFILKGIDFAVVFIVAKILGRLAYDKRYLKGKYFKHFWGWLQI